MKDSTRILGFTKTLPVCVSLRVKSSSAPYTDIKFKD